MVTVSCQGWGCGTPSKWPWKWLTDRGDPNCSPSTGSPSSKVPSLEPTGRPLQSSLLLGAGLKQPWVSHSPQNHLHPEKHGKWFFLDLNHPNLNFFWFWVNVPCEFSSVFVFLVSGNLLQTRPRMSQPTKHRRSKRFPKARSIPPCGFTNEHLDPRFSNHSLTSKISLDCFFQIGNMMMKWLKDCMEHLILSYCIYFFISPQHFTWPMHIRMLSSCWQSKIYHTPETLLRYQKWCALDNVSPDTSMAALRVSFCGYFTGVAQSLSQNTLRL